MILTTQQARAATTVIKSMYDNAVDVATFRFAGCVISIPDEGGVNVAPIPWDREPTERHVSLNAFRKAYGV